MKIQDIVLIGVLVVLIWLRNPRLSAGVGISSLVLSAPIFYSLSSLFTAQRLTYYAAAYFLVSIIQYMKGTK